MTKEDRKQFAAGDEELLKRYYATTNPVTRSVYRQILVARNPEHSRTLDVYDLLLGIGPRKREP